jgi:hypothetical protein
MKQEHELINQLLLLIQNLGGDIFIKGLHDESDEDGNPATWTDAEIEKAIAFVKSVNDNYSTSDATTVISNIILKYHLL